MNTEGMSADQISHLAADLAAKAIEMRRAERRKALELARQKERAENAAHYARMFTEIGQPLAGLNEKQHGLVYSLAWEQGHASGYSEVESYYGEFAEFALKIIDSI